MKISYLMPAYNKGLYISDAIRSVLSQRYKDQELVIVDDTHHWMRWANGVRADSATAAFLAKKLAAPAPSRPR